MDLVDPTLRSEYQAVSLRVTDEWGLDRWRVNAALVGAAEADRHLSWQLRAGRRHLTAHDPRGRTAQVTIQVT